MDRLEATPELLNRWEEMDASKIASQTTMTQAIRAAQQVLKEIQVEEFHFWEEVAALMGENIDDLARNGKEIRFDRTGVQGLFIVQNSPAAPRR